MRLLKDKESGMLFREGTSDIKSIKEVIHVNGYERRGFFKLEPNDKWLDIGGCVGSFSKIASERSASVITFEPYSVHFEILNMNLGKKKNVKLVNVGLSTSDEEKTLYLNTARQNTWRNSIHKSWQGGTKETIKIQHVKNWLDKCNAIKLDAEGVEKEILNWMLDNKKLPNKIVFEWSFDINKHVPDFFSVLEKLNKYYDTKGVTDNYLEKLKPHQTYPTSWFPPCAKIFCVKKTHQ